MTSLASNVQTAGHSDGRPRSMQELVRAASAYDYNPKIPLSSYVRGVENLRKQASVYEAEGDVETAFILLTRCAKLSLEELPQHKEFQSSDKGVAKHVVKTSKLAMESIRRLKPVIKHRHDHYLASSELAKLLETELSIGKAKAGKDASASSGIPSTQAYESRDAGQSSSGGFLDRFSGTDKAKKGALQSKDDAAERGKKKRLLGLRDRSPASSSKVPTAPPSPALIEDGDWALVPGEGRDRLDAVDKMSTTSSHLGQGGSTTSLPASRDSWEYLKPAETTHPQAQPGPYIPYSPDLTRKESYLHKPVHSSFAAAAPTYQVHPAPYPSLPHRTQHSTPTLPSQYKSPTRSQPRDDAVSHGRSTPQSQLYSWLADVAPSQAPPPRPDRPPVRYPEVKPPRPDKTPLATRSPAISAYSQASTTHEPPSPALAQTEAGVTLRNLVLPAELVDTFTAIALPNTTKNFETCGLLMGKLSRNTFTTTLLLVPKQTATSDTCEVLNEEEILAVSDSKDLMVLGWIHTHPRQSLFLSSLDLHSHYGYQQMLPEAIAIVVAPTSQPAVGIFRITDPPGLGVIGSCKEKGLFHPHPDLPLYTDADGMHVRLKKGLQLEVLDLR